MKARHKMNAEEAKEADYWFSLRHEKNESVRFSMMLKRAKRQCEKILENGERCPHKHGESGILIRGRIILTPKLGPKPFLECQKCGFQEIADKLSAPVMGRKTRIKVNPDQLSLV